MEIWKDVVGYEGSYQVSNFGGIKSLSRFMKYNNHGKVGYRLAKEIIKRPGKTRNGYYMVSLYKNDVEKKCSVSRLVAIAFISNPENKRTVNHIDGNKTNNNVSNLEWATQSENIINAYKNGLMKAPPKHKNLTFFGKHHTEETKTKIRESVRKARKNKFWSSQRRMSDVY